MTSSGKAEVTLPADNQILITRTFDAPRHLVWEAWTTPELIKRWWHANRGEMTVAEIDLRVGGSWRYVLTTHEGGVEVGFHGVCREIVPGERLVSTEVFEGYPDEEAVNTLTLTEEGARTMLTVLVEHSNRQGPRRPHRVRDGGRPAGRARPARGDGGLARRSATLARVGGQRLRPRRPRASGSRRSAGGTGSRSRRRRSRS